MEPVKGRLVPLLVLAVIVGCSAAEPVRPVAGGGVSPDAGEAFTIVDLESQANGRTADMPGLPEGEHEVGEVSFLIGPAYLKTGPGISPAAGIPIGRRFQKLHVLQGAHGGGFQQPGHPKHEQDGTFVGAYVIHYEDGGQESLPLVYGENLRDWWNWDQMRPTTAARVAWEGESPAARSYNVTVRLYQAAWENPYPDRRVRAIDLVSAYAKAAPFCVAMTLEGTSKPSGYE